MGNVLRKCKLLAARLGSAEFSQWIEWELNGYPESQPTPDYRRLRCRLYASFVNSAWQVARQPVPLTIVPEGHRRTFTEIEFREGIAKLQRFIDNGVRIDRFDVVGALQGEVYTDMACDGAWIEVPGYGFEQLTSAVKNRILDFALKIEAENPDAGEAPMNSQPVPMEKLRPLVNNFFGNVGNVAQSSREFSQIANLDSHRQDLDKLVATMENHLDELRLDRDATRKAEAQIATLKAQLIDQPNPIVVNQALSTLRNVVEGAIGSLIAVAVQPTVWQWVQGALTRLRY